MPCFSHKSGGSKWLTVVQLGLKIVHCKHTDLGIYPSQPNLDLIIVSDDALSCGLSKTKVSSSGFCAVATEFWREEHGTISCQLPLRLPSMFIHE